MAAFSHRQFLQAWFPSIAVSKDRAAFFHAYNEFLCTTRTGKQSALDDKLLMSGVLKVSGLPAPEILLMTVGGRFFSPLEGKVSREAAAKLLAGKDAFIKTRGGWGGEGAFRLHADGSVVKADGSKLDGSIPKLLKKICRSDYLVQELVRQDERYSAVAPASVNTVRCITMRDISGNIRVASVTWRMGNRAMVVDNASSGGMFCGVDPETGRIVGPAVDFTGTTYDSHPFSGFPFAGSEVPDIKAIFRVSEAAHRCLSTSLAIAWDVAMTPEGPTILEANGHWGVVGYELADPDFERLLWETFMLDRQVEGFGFPAEEQAAGRNEMIRATILIQGKVQGVRYRKWISRYAAERGVEAAPINLEDGTVRCQLTGQRWRVEFVTLACHRGPAAAEVERIDVQGVMRLG